jgi:hypothetical protein
MPPIAKNLLNTQRELAKIRNETQKEVVRPQNQAQIETLIADQEQKVLFDRMRNSVMQALFDPEMDPKHRQQILNTVTGLTQTCHSLPRPTAISKGVYTMKKFIKLLYAPIAKNMFLGVVWWLIMVALAVAIIWRLATG